jgi:hypothetical protein
MTIARRIAVYTHVYSFHAEGQSLLQGSPRVRSHNPFDALCSLWHRLYMTSRTTSSLLEADRLLDRAATTGRHVPVLAATRSEAAGGSQPVRSTSDMDDK